MPVNADEVLKNVKVQLGGDLLGRERITGVKKTRLGCDQEGGVNFACAADDFSHYYVTMNPAREF